MNKRHKPLKKHDPDNKIYHGTLSDKTKTLEKQIKMLKKIEAKEGNFTATLLTANNPNAAGTLFTEEALKKMAKTYKNLHYNKQKKTLEYSGKLGKISKRKDKL